MAVLLALAGAITYGCADFCGGLASRRAPTATVTLVSQVLGLTVLVPALLLVPGTLDGASLRWGAAAGLAGAVGLLLFYRALADGQMAVVAPLTAVTAAAVPVVAGLAEGERPALGAVGGVVLAVLAILLVSAEGGRVPTRAQLASAATATALAAGAAFGLLFVLLAQSGEESGIWPLLGARAASITFLALVCLRLRPALRVERGALALVLGAGVGDMAANVLFLLASREGLLSVTGVLVALYPAATVLLALVVLKERLAALQVAGLAVAAAAVALIAAS